MDDFTDIFDQDFNADDLNDLSRKIGDFEKKFGENPDFKEL